MAEHEHGTMDIKTQEKTFEGFVRFVSWTIVVIIVALIFVYLING